jgi:4-diphosphocytidyl-2-C-methyl-D-erythritol kinase
MLRVFAPAKINLCLHVTGQRADGYHLLDTVVGFANVGDWLTLTRGGAGQVYLSGPEAGQLSGENIITQTLAAFDAQDVDVHLEKNLPVASGIGGGSSDAAAAYRGIIALQGRAVEAADAAKLLSIGADVPMCAGAIPAHVQGIGEAITPLPNLAPLHAVLVNPRQYVATPQIFRALHSKQNAALPSLPEQLHEPDTLLNWLAAQRNDLQVPAIAAAPAIADVLAAITATGAGLTRMSGSGATCFGIYETAGAAQAASSQLCAQHPDWWIVPCQINDAVNVAPQAMRATT